MPNFNTKTLPRLYNTGIPSSLNLGASANPTNKDFVFQSDPAATEARDTFVNNIANVNPNQGFQNPIPKTPVSDNNFTTPSGAVVNPDGSVVSTPQKDPADVAFQSYLASLTPSSELTNAKLALNRHDTQAALDYEKALESGDTLGFARGEAGLTARNNAILRGGAAGAVQAYAALDENRSNISKARYDFEKAKIDEAVRAEEFDRQQTRLENPQFELSAGQARFDSEGNKIASLPNKPTTTTPKGTVTSGSLSYSPQAATEDSQALEQSRGEDGYVDSATYLQLYNAWIANGGLLKDFLSTYSPKNYVNPKDKTLPAYLKPSGSGLDNPFRT